MREGIAFLEMGGTMGFKDMHLARLAVRDSLKLCVKELPF